MTIVAAPAQAITGRTLVSVTSIEDSNNKSATATCPTGKKVIGAGGQIVDSYGKVHLTDVTPSADLSSVTVWGGEQVAFGGTTSSVWRVQAQAMCAPVSEFAELRRVSATGVTVVNPPSNMPAKYAIVGCPNGLQVFGTGYEINDANGNVVLQQVEPSSLYVVQGRVRPTEAGLPPYTFKLYAICGTPRATMTRVLASSPTDSNTTHGTVTNACASGTTLAGLGVPRTGQHREPDECPPVRIRPGGIQHPGRVLRRWRPRVGGRRGRRLRLADWVDGDPPPTHCSFVGPDRMKLHVPDGRCAEGPSPKRPCGRR